MTKGKRTRRTRGGDKDLEDRIQKAKDHGYLMVANNNGKDLFNEDLGWYPRMVQDDYGIIHCIGHMDARSNHPLTFDEAEKIHKTNYSDEIPRVLDHFLHGREVRIGAISYEDKKRKHLIIHRNDRFNRWVDLKNTGGIITSDNTVKLKPTFPSHLRRMSVNPNPLISLDTRSMSPEIPFEPRGFRQILTNTLDKVKRTFSRRRSRSRSRDKESS